MSIALLATGGTIACTQTENGLAPTLSASDLLEHLHSPLPCPVVPRDVFCMDSSNMQPEEWCVLAREVDRVLASVLNPVPFDPGASTRGLYLRGVE